MPLGAFKTALFGAAAGGADYVWDPIGFVHTDGSSFGDDGTPQIFQFSNIPQDYKHLVLQMGMHMGNSNGVVKLTLNGTTTTSHYWGRSDYVNGGSQGFYGTNGSSGHFTGWFGGWDGFVNTSTSVAYHGWTMFMDYSDSDCTTGIRSSSVYPLNPNAYYSYSIYSGTYNVESAITSMQMTTPNYFGQNCIMSLYGLRAE